MARLPHSIKIKALNHALALLFGTVSISAFCIPTAMAQSTNLGSLFGQVKPNTALQIVKADNSITRNVVTDAQGRFQVNSLPLGSYQVHLMMANKIAQTSKLEVLNNQAVEVVFKLPETTQSVQISATNPQPVGKFSLSGQELSHVAGAGGDPMRGLQSLPGVISVSDGNAAPAIRGSRPQDNTYYIDFLPVGYVYHMGGYLSVVHEDLVKRFDLYTGAFGPEFDDVHG
ncbi:MAG: carboxypeptidase regulatory-like domain-containing protein, partial [Undibacterium sp.]|nr:carboxypeptidase regulatory-like domain-containing protein [Undibacterium sp.]